MRATLPVHFTPFVLRTALNKHFITLYSKRPPCFDNSHIIRRKFKNSEASLHTIFSSLLLLSRFSIKMFSINEKKKQLIHQQTHEVVYTSH
jgi:hypothetical protein